VLASSAFTCAVIAMRPILPRRSSFNEPSRPGQPQGRGNPMPAS
jgi:hypothetical protein